MADVLVVDDERSLREFLEILLAREGHKVTVAEDAVSGIAKLKAADFDLVLTDLKLPQGSGMDVLRHVTESGADAQVILMTAFATTENAVEAMRLGAYDYVIKPFKVDELKVVIERALERKQLRRENTQLRETLDAHRAQNRLIGSSEAMREVFEMVRKVSGAKTNVLLTGESGTGKELVARAIHNRGPRAASPFVPINCGAIPENLIESELFGHVKGAFTGASQDKMGLFEQAEDGTVFLDEIGELPLHMQVRLLRVLQERTVRRVGGMKDTSIESRIIAATNRDLAEEVREGRFREDLYFRLNVIQIRLPALRERHADIPLLARAFLAKFAEEQASDVTDIDDGAMAALVQHAWPGNVRELENAIERAVTLASGPVLDLSDLPQAVAQAAGPRTRPRVERVEIPEDGVKLEEILESLERGYLEEALSRTEGKKKRAAALLGLSFRSFRYRVAKLGITAEDGDGDGDGDGN